jgi:hypothetical protein
MCKAEKSSRAIGLKHEWTAMNPALLTPQPQKRGTKEHSAAGAATKRLGLRQDAKHHGQQNLTVSLPFLYQFSFSLVNFSHSDDQR